MVDYPSSFFKSQTFSSVSALARPKNASQKDPQMKVDQAQEKAAKERDKRVDKTLRELDQMLKKLGEANKNSIAAVKKYEENDQLNPELKKLYNRQVRAAKKYQKVESGKYSGKELAELKINLFDEFKKIDSVVEKRLNDKIQNLNLQQIYKLQKKDTYATLQMDKMINEKNREIKRERKEDIATFLTENAEFQKARSDAGFATVSAISGELGFVTKVLGNFVDFEKMYQKTLTDPLKKALGIDQELDPEEEQVKKLDEVKEAVVEVKSAIKETNAVNREDEDERNAKTVEALDQISDDIADSGGGLANSFLSMLGGTKLGKIFGKIFTPISGLGKIFSKGGMIGKLLGGVGGVGGLAAGALKFAAPVGGALMLGNQLTKSQDEINSEGLGGKASSYGQAALSGALIGSAIPVIGTAVGATLGVAATAIRRNWDTISETATTAFDNVSEFADKTVSSIGSAGIQVFDTIKGFGKDAINGFESMGKDLASIWSDKLDRFMTDLLPDLGGRFGGVVKAGKEFFKTGSITSTVAAYQEGKAGTSEAIRQKTSQAAKFLGGSGQSTVQKSDKPTAYSGGSAKMGGFNVRGDVLSGIQEASNVSGIDQSFLMAMAAQESGFNPNAKAGTSSASGLYQFTDATWKDMVKKHGSEYGIGMGDRMDPRANAIMGGLFAKQNKDYLGKKLGREVNSTDLYAAHFLGQGGANKFLSNMDAENSVDVVGQNVADANKSIFYDKKGKPRSSKEVYSILQNKVESKASMYQDKIESPLMTAAPMETALNANQMDSEKSSESNMLIGGSTNTPNKIQMKQAQNSSRSVRGTGDTPWVTNDTGILLAIHGAT